MTVDVDDQDDDDDDDGDGDEYWKRQNLLVEENPVLIFDFLSQITCNIAAVKITAQFHTTTGGEAGGIEVRDRGGGGRGIYGDGSERYSPSARGSRGF